MSLFPRLLLLVAAFLTPGVAARGDTPQALQAQAAALRQMSIHDDQGRPLDLEHPHGRLLFVDFWASWCPACVSEVQGLESLQRQLGTDKINIVLVSLQSDWARDRAYAARHALPFPLYVYSPATVAIQIAALKGEAIGNTAEIGLPLAAIFLPNGRLLDSSVGSRDWASPPLVASLRTLVDAP